MLQDRAIVTMADQ